MALRMAENSLFAILLRSSWWYSAAAGIVIIALATAIARGQFLVMGVALSLPFFGIALFAVYKQLQRPNAKQLSEVAALARQMSASQVAGKIAENYCKVRFESAPFKGSAADLELTRGYRKILLSSKRFKAATTGIEPLKQLVAAGEQVEATGYIYVTLGDISANARQYAKDNDIDLIQAGELAAYFAGKVKIE